jgi:pimeloyl-ACP methyl ester carboxylesterase
MWFLALIAALVLGTTGCNSCEPGVAPMPASSAGPRADATAPGSERRALDFTAADGARLAGDFYPAPGAPALVLVHRLTADRSEWQPLLARLRRASRQYAVLNFDLRGHGQSGAAAEGGSAADSPEHFERDVKAAVARAAQEAGADRVVLVGSSLGATLAARAALEAPLVSAIALVSPGAAIQGADIYRAYAEVRNLPTFLAASEVDTVSREPLSALGKMAMVGTSKVYAGEVHGAGFLGERHPEFWQDLEAWLMSVHDEIPRERRSLYYADGVQPAKAQVPTKARARPRAPSSLGAGAGKQE